MNPRLEWRLWGALLGVFLLPLGSVLEHREVWWDACCEVMVWYHDARFAWASAVWLCLVGVAFSCRRTRFATPAFTLVLVGVWLTLGCLAGTEPSRDWRWGDPRGTGGACIMLC